MSLFLHRSAIMGGGGGSSPLITVSYDDIDYTEIGTGTAGAAERTIPTGVTNLTLTSSDLQGTAAGNILRLQFGFNDGVSTTWYTTSGDYRRNLESDLSNSVSDRDDIHVFEDVAAGGTLSRPHAWSFSADCLHLAVPTTTVGCEYFNDSPPGASNDGAFLTHVMTDAVVINRFRVFFPTTTGASGSIRVKYETRPVSLISTLVGTSGVNNFDIDVTGYSSVRLVSTDLTTNINAESYIRLSFDNGSTFDATSGNYNFVSETGGTSSNGNTTVFFAKTGSNTTQEFSIEILNLDVAAPTISATANMIVGASARRDWGIHNNTSAVTDIRLYFGPTAVTSTGSVYVVGDATPSVLIDTIAMTEYTDPGTIAANPNPVVSHSVASYGRITACAFTATTAAAIQPMARISDDSGSTFETAGAYAYKVEDGGNEAQLSAFGLYPFSTTTAGTSTNARFFMFAENVNLQAPMFGWGGHFLTDGKASQMVKANTPVTDFGLIWLDAAFTDHVAGSTGTVYLVGRE